MQACTVFLSSQLPAAISRARETYERLGVHLIAVVFDATGPDAIAPGRYGDHGELEVKSPQSVGIGRELLLRLRLDSDVTSALHQAGLVLLDHLVQARVGEVCVLLPNTTRVPAELSHQLRLATGHDDGALLVGQDNQWIVAAARSTALTYRIAAISSEATTVRPTVYPGDIVIDCELVSDGEATIQTARVADLWHRRSDGVALDRRTRRLLLDALGRAKHIGIGLPPPDPFGTDPAAVDAWLNTIVAGTPSAFPISRYLADIWATRTDLMEQFPTFDTAEHRSAFLEWCQLFGIEEEAIDPLRLPRMPVQPPQLGGNRGKASAGPTGELTLLVAGYLSAALGLGEAARLVAERARGAGLSVATYDYRHRSGSSTTWLDRQPGRQLGGAPSIAVLAVNGSEVARLSNVVGDRLPATTYRIGLWFWEGKVLPPSHAEGLSHVDEVWVTSEFTAAAVRQAIAESTGHEAVTVHVLPLGSTPPADTSGKRAYRRQLGLPDRFLVGFSFDLASTLDRKNPGGLIDAWKFAFPRTSHVTDGPATNAMAPTLVLKTMSGELHPERLAELRAKTAGRTDIVVIDADFSPAQQRRFMASLDAYASLHRSEGYGLLLLESLALGLPTIATGVTGNLAFMTADNSWLVPARETILDKESGVYPAGTVWHEPDLNAAAAALREVVRGGADVRTKTERARLDVASLIDGSAAQAWIVRRLGQIRGTLQHAQTQAQQHAAKNRPRIPG
jgi:glycosyltransferase involved in cell wall biosynthesis